MPGILSFLFFCDINVNFNTTDKMSLIDFGACREYRKDFVDDYLKLVWSAANKDDAEIMRV